MARVTATPIRALLFPNTQGRQFQKLFAQREIISTTVIRAGQQVLVPNIDIVVGDVLLLDTGDKVRR